MSLEQYKRTLFNNKSIQLAASRLVLGGTSLALITPEKYVDGFSSGTVYITSDRAYALTAYFYDPFTGYLSTNGNILFGSGAATTATRPSYKEFVFPVCHKAQFYYSNAAVEDAVINLTLAVKS